MKIYEFESKAGLSSKILNSTKASCDFPLITEQTQIKGAKAAELFKDSEYGKEYLSKTLDADLLLVHGILVSTNWNKNDDVFTPEETWLARNTPLYKPVNMEHIGSEQDGNTILGCINFAQCVDDQLNSFYPKGEKIDDDENFDILIGAVLWEKYFPTTVSNIKTKCKENTCNFSMECIFTDFGYALRRDKEILLLDRNEITSWLTAYLRIYGGEGVVEIDGMKYQIGRWIKSLTFSGVAFVENPANPRSIVFEDYISKSSVKKISDKNFQIKRENCVLNSSKGLSLWVLK